MRVEVTPYTSQRKVHVGGLPFLVDSFFFYHAGYGLPLHYNTLTAWNGCFVTYDHVDVVDEETQLSQVTNSHSQTMYTQRSI